MSARRFDPIIHQLLNRCGAVAHKSVAYHIYNRSGLAGAGAYQKLASLAREGEVESVPLNPDKGGQSHHCVVAAGANHGRLPAKCQLSETVLERARQKFKAVLDHDGRLENLASETAVRPVVSDLYAGEKAMIERLKELRAEGCMEVEISDSDPLRRAQMVEYARAIGFRAHACESFTEHKIAMTKPKQATHYRS